MNHGNPFAQWSDQSGALSQGAFGALPTSPTIDKPIRFYLAPDVLNTSVMGPHNAIAYTVTSDAQLAGYTVIRDSRSKQIGLIEWQRNPFVEVRGSISKKKVGTWLRLSSDSRYRTMDFAGSTYTWAPDNVYINLFSSSGSRLLARVGRFYDSVMLEVSEEAVHRGMLDCIIAAVILLQSGKHID